LLKKAGEDGLLKSLSAHSELCHSSLFADDVVIFLQPVALDLEVTMDILNIFREASGLKTSMEKSSVFPIHCSAENVSTIHNLLPCHVANFPCKYLGVPLSLKRLGKHHIQPFIDKIADRLPSWKADLLSRAGRLILVQSVLSSMMVYLAMALDLPSWDLKAIDKIRRNFLWRGRKEAMGGHCLVAWNKVTRPKELGGLCISHLQHMCWALRLRWLWLKKTKPDRPWAAFNFHVHPSVLAFFSVAVSSEVDNGRNTLFWTDKWLNGQSLQQLAPHLVRLVSSRARKRSVQDALTTGSWVQDIRGAITVNVLTEFFKVWDLAASWILHPEQEDKHIWLLSSSGNFTAKSSYDGFFIGSTTFRSWRRIWKSWAPGKYKFFMWLVAHGRCWTADRLARRGLPHPQSCLLCDQEEETMNHLLVSCVFSREVWFNILKTVDLQHLSPSLDSSSFDDWWENVSMTLISPSNKKLRKGLNSLIILGAWAIWIHRNQCVFNGEQPRASKVINWVMAESHFGVGLGLADYLISFYLGILFEELVSSMLSVLVLLLIFFCWVVCRVV
jgi:hypothetical protein